MQPTWAIALGVLTSLIVIVLVCRHMIKKNDIPTLEEQEREAWEQLYPGTWHDERRRRELERGRDA